MQESYPLYGNEIVIFVYLFPDLGVIPYMGMKIIFCGTVQVRHPELSLIWE